MTAGQLFRHLLNTLTGINLFGVLVGVFARGAPTWDSRFGLLVFMNCRIVWPRAAAMTFGDIVVVRRGNWQQVADIPKMPLWHDALLVRLFVDIQCEDSATESERDDPGEAAQRVARTVVETLSRVTEEGYVFRVDLRLRPASEVSPLAISFDAIARRTIARER